MTSLFETRSARCEYCGTVYVARDMDETEAKRMANHKRQECRDACVAKLARIGVNVMRANPRDWPTLTPKADSLARRAGL